MSSTQTPAAVSNRIRQLWQQFEKSTEFREAVAALSRAGQATFDGVKGSSCALLAAALFEQAPSTLVLISSRPADADALRDDLELFTASPQLRFPAWEAEPGERIAWPWITHDSTPTRRLRRCRPRR